MSQWIWIHDQSMPAPKLFQRKANFMPESLLIRFDKILIYSLIHSLTAKKAAIICISFKSLLNR